MCLEEVCPVCAATLWLSGEPGIVRIGCAFLDRKVEKVCAASTQALDDLNMKSSCSPSIAVSTYQGLSDLAFAIGSGGRRAEGRGTHIKQ